MATLMPTDTRAALVSVGGAPAPILFTLRQHRPAHVWYFCSAATATQPGSQTIAEVIQAQLDWHPVPRFIEVQRFEELGPCYHELRRKIPELLDEARVSRTDVLVDYTGGTKTMTAALVLAATELFDRFSYVGGEQREKGGLGVTVEGKERVFYQSNPWNELAVREVERACDLWAGALFDTAAQVLRAAAARVTRRHRFEAVAEVAEAMAARYRLDFREATRLLGRKLQEGLALLFDGQDDHGLAAFARGALQSCSACAQGVASPVFLREVLDNALRTAAQGRFEDAAARLYRGMEMQGQLWLHEATNGVFVNGRCRRENIEKIPAGLTTLDFCRPDGTGEVRLSVEQLFRALHRLGDARAAKVVADIEREPKSRWRQATEKRNTSILAHGVNSIGEEGFEAMKQTAADFLGFDLAREANPIPPLDERWL